MKTPEEILGPSFYPHECGSMIECVTYQDAIEAIKASNEAIINEYRESIERKVTGMDVLGADGCTWGDTIYDSNAVAYGYNTALDDVKSMIIKQGKEPVPCAPLNNRWNFVQKFEESDEFKRLTTELGIGKEEAIITAGKLYDYLNAKKPTTV